MPINNYNPVNRFGPGGLGAGSQEVVVEKPNGQGDSYFSVETVAPSRPLTSAEYINNIGEGLGRDIGKTVRQVATAPTKAIQFVAQLIGGVGTGLKNASAASLDAPGVGLEGTFNPLDNPASVSGVGPRNEPTPPPSRAYLAQNATAVKNRNEKPGMAFASRSEFPPPPSMEDRARANQLARVLEGRSRSQLPPRAAQTASDPNSFAASPGNRLPPTVATNRSAARGAAPAVAANNARPQPARSAFAPPRTRNS